MMHRIDGTMVHQPLLRCTAEKLPADSFASVIGMHDYFIDVPVFRLVGRLEISETVAPLMRDRSNDLSTKISD